MSEQRMEMPYSALIGKKNNRSKSFLMISELIDNSLSSWNGDKPLIIDIIIDTKGKKISVIDNGSGMGEKTLEDSVRLNKETIGNNLNMFGVGMKNCAFWFGQDLLIETKQKNGIPLMTKIFTSTIEDINETIKWEVVESKEWNQVGTKITLLNIYDGRLIKPKEFEEIHEFLSHKYSRYLLQKTKKTTEKVFMNIKYINKNETKNKDINIKARQIKGQVISEENIDVFISNLKQNLSNYNLKHITNLEEIIIDKVNDMAPLIFNYEHKFIKENGEGYDLKFKFGVQNQPINPTTNESKNFKKNFGICTFQKDRAINISPVNPLTFKSDYTRSNIKRIFGEVDLGNIWKPDNNKVEFNFGVDKENFQELINELGEDLLKLADSVFATIASKINVKQGNKKSDIPKIQNSLSMKSNWEWKVNEFGAIIKYNKNGDYKFEIIESIPKDNDLNAEYFLDAKPKENSENHFIIKYNPNHLIWKPLSNDNSNVKTKTVIYPLIAIIGISSIAINNGIYSEFFGDGIYKGMNENYINIINDLVKNGIK